MKRYLVIVSLFFLTSLIYTAPPVEIVNPSLKVNVISSPQPQGIEIFNYSLNDGQVQKLVDKNWNYSYFYIFNATDYTLYLSTSTNFSTSFRLPKGGIFASDVIATIYGKIVGGSGTVDVLIEK